MIIVDPASEEVIKELPQPSKIVIVDVKGEKGNPIYTYKIPVKIDLRTALRLNITDFSINVLNKSFSSISSTGFLNSSQGDTEKQYPRSPQDLNSKINNFSEKEMITHFNSQKNAIVSTFNVDFRDILNKQVMQKFANLTDEQLFGTENIVVVANASLDRNNSKDLTITLDDPSAADTTMTFQKAVDALYQEGGDPASSFEPVQDELSFRQSAQGLTPNYRGLKKKNNRYQNLKASVRSVFMDEITGVNESAGPDIDSKLASLSSNRLKTFRINQSLRVQEVNFYVDVSQQTISETGGIVYLVINNKGQK